MICLAALTAFGLPTASFGQHLVSYSGDWSVGIASSGGGDFQASGLIDQTNSGSVTSTGLGISFSPTSLSVSASASSSAVPSSEENGAGMGVDGDVTMNVNDFSLDPSQAGVAGRVTVSSSSTPHSQGGGEHAGFNQGGDASSSLGDGTHTIHFGSGLSFYAHAAASGHTSPGSPAFSASASASVSITWDIQEHRRHWNQANGGTISGAGNQWIQNEAPSAESYAVFNRSGAPNVTLPDSAKWRGLIVDGRDLDLTINSNLVLGSSGYTGSSFTRQSIVVGEGFGPASLHLIGPSSRTVEVENPILIGKAAGSGGILKIRNGIKVFSNFESADYLDPVTGAQNIVGYRDNGQLHVESGSRLELNEVGLFLGATPGVNGLLRVSGSGSYAYAQAFLPALENASADVVVENGATAEFGTILASESSGSLTTMIIKGAGSTLRQLEDSIFAAARASGSRLSLRVENGGYLDADETNVSIGGTSSDRSTLVVTGAGSKLSASSFEIQRSDFTIENQATVNTSSFTLLGSNLTIESAASLTADGLYILNATPAVGGVVASEVTIRSASINITNSPIVPDPPREIQVASTSTLRLEGNGATVTGFYEMEIYGNVDVGANTTLAGSIIPWGTRTGQLADVFIEAGGRLAGSGTVVGNVQPLPGGTLALGNSPGILTIDGDVNMAPGSTLEVEFEGTTPGSAYDRLVVTGDLDLSGDVLLAFRSRFAPQAGQTFDIFDVGGSLTGTPNFSYSGLLAGWQYSTDFADGVTRLTSLNDAVAAYKLAQWNGGSGNWSATSNWDIGEVPDRTVELNYDAAISGGDATLDQNATVERLDLSGGTLRDGGDYVLTAAERFNWTGGALAGEGNAATIEMQKNALSNWSGTLSATNGWEIVNRGNLNVADGTSISRVDSDYLSGPVFTNSAEATTTFAGSGSWEVRGTGGGAGAPKIFLNEGTLRKEGAGTFIISGGSGSDPAFVNTGRVEVLGGNLTVESRSLHDAYNGSGMPALDESTSEWVVRNGANLTLVGSLSEALVSGSTLSGGTWEVGSGGSITIDTSIDTIGSGATVLLDGAGASFAALSGLTANRGLFQLANGHVFTTAGDFTNEGKVHISGATSALVITGLFTQEGGSITLEDGGTFSAGTISLEDADVFLAGTITGDVIAGGSTMISQSDALSPVTITGNLTMLGDAKLDFAMGLPLTVTGVVSLDSTFGIDNILGLDSSVPLGTYTLINGTATDFEALGFENWGEENAYDLGGGKAAYFSRGSLQVQVIPEPGTAVLVGLGLAALLLRRRAR